EPDSLVPGDPGLARLALGLHRWQATRDFVAGAAASLVRLFRADDDDRVVVERGDAVDDPLRARRRFAADDADRLQLLDALGEREERRHGAERLAAEVLIEARADDTSSVRDERTDDMDDAPIEELDLVDADDARVECNDRGDLFARAHRARD